MNDRKTIAVIFGGQSSEHEVSRLSAQSVISNIDGNKFDIVMIGITKDGRWLYYDGPVDKIGNGEWQQIAENREQTGFKPGTGILSAICPGIGDKRIDVVFPVLHGCNGEDGTVQGLLELAGVPYVGSGVLGSALGMDKAYAKIIFEKEGIPQGKYLVFNRKDIECGIDSVISKVEGTLEYPCFVKPSNSGSSVGVSKAHDRSKLIDALKYAAGFDRRILVEEFIDGREVECAVLGNDEPSASIVGEVIPCNEFYDYDAKYLKGDSSRVVIPAELPEHIVEEVRKYAIKAFKALDCAGLSRVDFFVQRKTGVVYINEINTLPGFTNISMYSKLWEASGIPYAKLIEKLVELAEERFAQSRRSTCVQGK